ncbi:MAG TPA: hypothetical protein VNN73_12365 [Blastocatellia bacterium]|nr:hypothetical protein [Blastocatellia bacterium]
MRKTSVIAAMLLLSSVALAVSAKDSVKLDGYVVDNACATAHAKDANVADTVKNHPTSCALMPNCAKSGYAVLADGKLYKLDEAGNKQVAALLKKTKSKNGLHVAVEGTVEGDTLHATKISEAKM